MERARHAASHTWDDFVRLPDDDRRELVDGILVEVDVPTKWHERIVVALASFLYAWGVKRRRVVLASGFKLRVTQKRGVMPDLQVLTEEAYEQADDSGMTRGRPEIVVEVVSAGSRAHDRVRKLQWYAAIGVPEYWIVDPRERSIERLVWKDGTYELRECAVGNEIFRPRGIRGLAIPLAELWRALDRKPSRPARPRRR